MTASFFKNYFTQITQKVHQVDLALLKEASLLITGIHKKGGKVIVAGNGGSAAMASHVAVDFTKATQIRSINFNEADLITCFANDYGYENWLKEALIAYADNKDLVILISSSGQSANMIKAAEQTKIMNLPLITLSGFKSTNPLRKQGDINFWVESKQYNEIEMTHHIWLLAIVDYLIEQKNNL